jgi:hypothetical protein
MTTSKSVSERPSRPAVVRRSAAQWKALVDSHRKSGLTQTAFCAREGISAMSLSSWRKRLSAKPEETSDMASPSFVEITPPLKAIEQALTLRLELGAGIVLTVTRAP